jgi:hypothetical protein
MLLASILREMPWVVGVSERKCLSCNATSGNPLVLELIDASTKA